MLRGSVYVRYLFILLLGTVFFRLIYVNFTGLVPDEAYYWDLSRILQLSYYDHPPMLMYLIAFSTKIFGANEFAVRFPSVIIGCLATLLIFLLGKELFDERVGFYSAVLSTITLIYSVGGILATIDTPFAFFWLLALYFGVKALKTGEGFWWYLKDIALGLGMLSKYIMVLFVPAFFIFLVLSREHRHWLRRKEPYVGGIIALLVFSPVIIWNFQNDWASFKFQLSHGLKIKKKSGFSSFGEYIGSQLAVLSPFLFAACVWAMIRGAILWAKGRDWRYLYLTVFSVFVLFFFGYSSFRAKVEGNWPMSAYFTSLIALSYFYLNSGFKKKKVFASIIVGTSLALIVFSHVQALTPIISIKKDPTDQFYGWRELGAEVGKAYIDIEKESPGLFILADSHQLTAELAFYIPSQPRVYETAGVGKFNQYNMWEAPEKGRDAILVVSSGKGSDPDISSLFEEISEIKKVELERGKKILKTYSIYSCKNFLGFAVKEIKKVNRS